MYPTVDIIAIGQLSQNPFWDEKQPVRPPLATATLVRVGDTTILVDPSLPAELMAGRLHERAGLVPARIDMVFLTSFHPTHRRGLALFEESRWLIGGRERQAVAAHLMGLLAEEEDVPARETIEAELALLGRMEDAPDTLANGVDLFPSPGVTPGHCGLLVSSLQTTIIAGDTVLTREHFERNAIAARVADEADARASLAEMYEIADIIVPGHDNLMVIHQGL